MKCLIAYPGHSWLPPCGCYKDASAVTFHCKNRSALFRLERNMVHTMYDNLLKTISTQVIFPFIRHSAFLRKSTRKLRHRQAIGLTIYSKRLFEFSEISIWDICPIEKAAFAAGWLLLSQLTLWLRCPSFSCWSVWPLARGTGGIKGGCFHDFGDSFQVQERMCFF